MKTYYFHYRIEDFGYDDEDPFSTRLAARGGLTLAYRLVGENQVFGQVEVEVGVAFCSVKDNYHKATGRRVAEAMLKEKPLRLTTYTIFNPAGQLNFASLRYNLFDTLVDEPAFDALVPRKFPIHEVI